MSEEVVTKSLKIEMNLGYFFDGFEYKTIELITKDDLLKLVNASLGEEFNFDPYDEALLKNQAHQVIYKSVVGKLSDLNRRRNSFFDEKSRIYLDEYNKYKSPSN